MTDDVVPYPSVLDEFATVRAVLAGKSLARLGDGEIKHAYGKDGGRQRYHPDLSLEMRMVLVQPHSDCIVGIPTMDPAGPKIENWLRHRDRFLAKLSPQVQYYSAFVTRPDSAPWIDNHEFCALFQDAWAGKHAVVIAKKGGKTVPLIKLAARKVTHLGCPERDAYGRIDRLELVALEVGADVAIISAGPTATVLANRLAGKGLQAIDIGSAGAFLLRHLGNPAKV